MIRRLFSDAALRARFVSYLVVGGASAVVQFSVLWLVEDRWHSDVAFTVAYAVSVATHYLLARFWALPSGRRDSVRQFGEYLVALGVSYVINLAAFKLGHDGFGLSVMWAAVWAIPPSTIVVFLLLNFRVFRAKP